jgi:putative peptide zinc metalloprotease protein
VNRNAGRLLPLHRAPVVVAALIAALVTEVLAFRAGVLGQMGGALVSRPGLLLAGYGLLIGSVAFHELGHASACRYGGGTPGRIGMGVYLAWPVLFADVTDSYRLGRWARVRTDLGGLYFNTILLALFGAIYGVTHHPVAGVGLLAQNLIILEQLLPVIRLDGYWCISDLAGVPDLYRYVVPLLGSLLPWRRRDPAVVRLTRGARRAVTLWVVAAVPFLAVNGFFVLYYLVGLLRTGWLVLVAHIHLITGAAQGHHPVLLGVLALVELVLVVLPMFGLPLLALTMGRAAVVKLRAWQGPSAAIRLLAGLALFAPAAGLVLLGGLR